MTSSTESCFSVLCLFTPVIIFGLTFLRATAATAAVAHPVSLRVRPSVTRADQSKTVQARITRSSPSAAWKTLVSGTVKLIYKFEGGHPERRR